MADRESGQYKLKAIGTGHEAIGSYFASTKRWCFNASSGVFTEKHVNQFYEIGERIERKGDK